MTALPPPEPFAVTHRGVFAIALPMTLAYLTTPLVGIVSLGVIGRLGEPALVGGVSIGGVIFDIVFLTFNFLRAGTTGLVAQALGAGDRRAIAATIYRALALAIGFGSAVIVLQLPIVTIAQQLIGGSEAVKAATRTYWDVRVLAAPLALANYVVLGWLIGLGRAGFGLCLQIVLNGINIVLGIVLVHGLGFGVAGVGWASVTAEASAAALGVIFIFALTARADRPRLAEVFNGAAFGRLVALNRDIMIRTFALLFAFAVFTSQSAAAGDVVLAANEILMNLIVFAAFFLDGLAAAAEQLSGRAIGARYRPSFERAVRLTVLWGFAVGAVLTIVMLAAGGAIVDLMSTSLPVRAAARNVLVWAALFPLFGTLVYQMDGVFIGATWSVDMRNAMLVSLGVYLVAGWLLAMPLGITGWWIALLVFLATRGLTLLWRSRVRIGPAFAGQPAAPTP
jgi:MATE family multidrug resistance protein